MRLNQEIEVFPDGVVEIHEEKGRRLGPVKGHFRFEQQSVGIRRYYEAVASVATNRIDRVIKIPINPIAQRMDLAVITDRNDKQQYRILRIQEKPERAVELLELQSVQVAIAPEEV